MAKLADEGKTRHISKKCPNCFIYLPMNATECSSCKTKVGEVNRHGIATRPTNWLGYLVAVLAWIGFSVYIWWAFIRETP